LKKQPVLSIEVSATFKSSLKEIYFFFLYLFSKILSEHTNKGITKKNGGGAWVAWSAECPTLGFGSGRYLRALRWSPTSGSALGMEPA